MRVYGRVTDELGVKRWVEVDTTPDGNSEYVYVTALVQVIKLQLGESPFFANYGIPAKQSVLMQIAPDIYAARIQQQYAQHFASLIIARSDTPPETLKIAPVPTYRVSVLLFQGTRMNLTVPV